MLTIIDNATGRPIDDAGAPIQCVLRPIVPLVCSRYEATRALFPYADTSMGSAQDLGLMIAERHAVVDERRRRHEALRGKNEA